MKIEHLITGGEILNSRFCNVNENRTRVTVTRPTFNEARAMDYRMLVYLLECLG